MNQALGVAKTDSSHHQTPNAASPRTAIAARVPTHRFISDILDRLRQRVADLARDGRQFGSAGPSVSSHAAHDRALALLKERFAKGEIDSIEFAERKKLLAERSATRRVLSGHARLRSHQQDAARVLVSCSAMTHLLGVCHGVRALRLGRQGGECDDRQKCRAAKDHRGRQRQRRPHPLKRDIALVKEFEKLSHALSKPDFMSCQASSRASRNSWKTIPDMPPAK